MSIEIKEIGGEYKTTVITDGDKEEAFRWVVDNQQYLHINNIIVDLFSAQCVVQVLNQVKEEFKSKLLSCEVPKICSIVLKLI